MNFNLRFRNGRQRLALLLAVAFGTILLVFLMHNTHGKMVALQERASDCEQKQESLSAQLQVFVEHKGRLEKGLQQEKLNHKQTKDKLEAQYEELQELIEKEKSEANAKYSALQQQYKRLQDKSEDQLLSVQEELKRVQDLNKELMENQMEELRKMNAEMESLKVSKNAQIVEIQGELNKVREERMSLLERLEQRSGFDQLELDLKICQKRLDSSGKISSSVIVPTNMVAQTALRPNASILKPFQSEPRHNQDPVIGNSIPRLMPPRQVSKISDHVSQDEIAKNVGPPPDFHILEKRVVSSDNKPYDAFADHQIPVPNNEENHMGSVAEIKPHLGQIDDPVMEHNLDKPRLEIPQQNIYFNRNRHVVDENQEDRKEGPKVRDFGADGLEQQENGEDQDLDNMENEVAIGKKGNQQFEDADFDQAGDQGENEDAKQEIAHK